MLSGIRTHLFCGSRKRYMILPIHVYGSPVLQEPTIPVKENTPELQELIDNMLETMHGASGIGLAAPQVGRSERLFVVDVSPLAKEEPNLPEGPLVFINPQITEEGDIDEEYEEGCLSIPDLREYIVRPESISVTYLDRDFNEQHLEVDGMLARVIQHEYDHLEGILFIDHISSFKRRLMRRRLKDMINGKVQADYPLYFWENEDA